MRTSAILATICLTPSQRETEEQLYQNLETGFLSSFSLPIAWGLCIQAYLQLGIFLSHFITSLASVGLQPYCRKQKVRSGSCGIYVSNEYIYIYIYIYIYTFFMVKSFFPLTPCGHGHQVPVLYCSSCSLFLVSQVPISLEFLLKNAPLQCSLCVAVWPISF